MATQTENKVKQRLIEEIQRRSEKRRCAPKSQREQLARELAASRNRLSKANGSPEGEV